MPQFTFDIPIAERETALALLDRLFPPEECEYERGRQLAKILAVFQ